MFRGYSPDVSYCASSSEMTDQRRRKYEEGCRSLLHSRMSVRTEKERQVIQILIRDSGNMNFHV